MIDLPRFIVEFTNRFDSEARVFSAPGRVNLIGEHTDYNEGFVLPFAIDRRTYVACSPRSDGKVRTYTMTLDQEVEFDVSDIHVGDKDWAVYIRGMTTMLARRGVVIPGADLLIDTEIPFGAGLSSSAALEIAVGMALAGLANAEITPLELARAGQDVEHEFVGLRSGIMDQLVSASATSGNALLIDCRSLETKPVRLNLKDMILVVCDTQVKHELASSAYNERRAQCEEGVELLRQYLPDIHALRDVTMQELARYESSLPEVIVKRCRHVVTENARTNEAADAVAEGDLVRVGHLMHLSHDSLRDDYEVSCPELDLLVDTAEAIEGVAGARMTGGGFGGCTINLLKKEVFEKFSKQITAAYESSFGRPPVIFAVEPSDGARLEI